MNTHVLSCLEYNAPILAGEDAKTKDRTYRVIHGAACYIRGNYCFRESIISIMRSVKWKIPKEFSEDSSEILVHKNMFEQNPRSLVDQIKIQRLITIPDVTFETQRIAKTALCVPE